MAGDLASDLLLVLSDLQRSGEIPTQVPVDDITECDELGSLGIDSVARVSLQAAIEERWGIVVEGEDFQGAVKFKELVACIRAKLPDEGAN